MDLRPPAAARAARRLAAAAVLGVAWLAFAREASATFPRLVSARALDPGAAEVRLAGTAANTDPDHVAAWVAGRRGLFRSVELGARLGAIRQDRAQDGSTGPLFGVDAKVQVLRESIDIPLDVAVDVGWTVGVVSGETYSDLSVAGLFGWSVRALPVFGDVVVTVGAEMVFLDGSARPGADETAAYGLASVELALGRHLAFTPEVKVGTHVVYGAALRYRF